jgi:hypothetical protein
LPTIANKKPFMRFPALLLALCLPLSVSALCPQAPFVEGNKVRLQGDRVLIVTHATVLHDARFATKRGVDEAVQFAKDRKIPVIYLQDDGPEKGYFMQDCQPDYRVHSEGGELGFEVAPSQVYIVGGHLELCLDVTVNEVLYSWAKQRKTPLTLTYFMDGIYSNGKSIEESDPFYADYERFMNVVTYRRPGGEHWPKLSLLEIMGLIRDQEHELAYLKKILPHYDATLKGYRVELMLNDSVAKVLQTAPGWNPPTIRFHFIDSAVDLADEPQELRLKQILDKPSPKGNAPAQQ